MSLEKYQISYLPPPYFFKVNEWKKDVYLLNVKDFFSIYFLSNFVEDFFLNMIMFYSHSYKILLNIDNNFLLSNCKKDF